MSASAIAVMLLVAGCSFGGADAGAPAGTPAGGWPQPEGGQLTAKMCGLVTLDDYRQLGHRQIVALEPGKADAFASNAVTCSAPPADTLTLILQPTTEAAKIWYRSSLSGRKKRVTDPIEEKRDTILSENVVSKADESWFDYWVNSGDDDKYKDYELELRRGALVVGLVLSGVDTSKEKDPKGTLVKLAERVLERVPDLGRTDSGTTPQVHLDVKGAGKATQIQYSVPDSEVTTLQDVQLPWKIDVPMADHGKQLLNINLSANTQVYPPIQLSCAITVDTKVIQQQQRAGIVNCQGHLPGP
jgi:hypothetical protein